MKTYPLKITSAVVIDGTIRKAGAIVYLGEDDAKRLLNRGKVVVATADDVAEVTGHIAGVVGADGTITNLADMPEGELQQLATDMGVDAEGKTAAELAEAIQAEPVQAVAEEAPAAEPAARPTKAAKK